MSDFADLWSSVTPNANKKPTNNQPLGTQLNANGANRNASGLNSQPNSRTHTPSYFSNSGISSQPSGQSQRPNPSLSVTGAAAKSPPSASAGDAFGDLFSLSGTSQTKNMTIAQRQALANQEQAKAQERAQKEREANGAFWDRLEFSTSGRSTPMSNSNRSTGSLATQPQPQAPRINTELLMPSRLSPLPSSKPTASAVTPASNADMWDLDSFLTSSKPISPAPAASSVVSPGPKSAQTHNDLFDLLDPTPSSIQENIATSERNTPIRSGTPGDFDWGDREDNDDLLGELSRPVSQTRKERSQPTLQSIPADRRESTPIERNGSPPPHILGQIVEMGFSIQQAKRALASTSTGTDVQAALDSLLAIGNRDSREDQGPSEDGLERYRAEDEAAREQYEIERQRRRARRSREPVRDATPETNNDDSARQLQERADQLLAQASVFGTNMFNRANALWKEGKEKAMKAYEERSAPSPSSGRSRDPARPAWMTEEPSPRDSYDSRTSQPSGFRDDDSDSVLPPRPQPQQKRPAADRQTSQPTIVTTAPPRPADKLASLFSDTTAYVSPSRRKPPSHTPTPVQPTPAENRITSPPVKLRTRNNPSVSADTLSAVQSHRNKGTDAFKLGQYGNAIDSYTAALDLLPEGHLTRIVLLNNRAAARSKIGDTSGAIDDCTIVLHVIGDDFDPARETPTPDVDLNAAFVKALRRRAEMFESTEKWKRAREDWERLVKAGGTWAGGKASSDGVQGVGRCKRMEDGGVSKPRAPVAPTKPKPRPRPAPARTAPSNPEDSAVHRLKVANAAAEAEGDQKHALKDTIDARILAWKGGKENNIRALIASLDTVLWPELGWTKVGMHELVMPNQVKVKYVRAIAKVHPDKLNTSSTTTEQRMIANSVFGALNEAWNAFEQ